MQIACTATLVVSRFDIVGRHDARDQRATKTGYFKTALSAAHVQRNYYRA